jgi:xanthine/CO dehydrogenase XdhC/CoxF family maturation factor
VHLGTRHDPSVDARAPGGAAIFVNEIPPPTALVIFGAGDDAQPLARLAHELGWNVTVADPRAAFTTKERFPTANTLVVGPAADLVNLTSPDAESLTVIMTHHYVHDVPLLRALLPRQLTYLGLLGPKKRAERILSDIGRDGLAVTDAMRNQVRAPVGLDLGADTPEEVALAIVAEIQAVLGGRDARPLRERNRPIHE